MRILLIDNDVFVQKKNSLCIFKTTGEFAVELKELGNKVELFQTKLEFTILQRCSTDPRLMIAESTTGP